MLLYRLICLSLLKKDLFKRITTYKLNSIEASCEVVEEKYYVRETIERLIFLRTIITKRDKSTYKTLRLFLIISWTIFTLFYVLPVPLFAKSFFLLLMVTFSSIYGGLRWGLWSCLWFVCVRVGYHFIVPIDPIGLLGGLLATVLAALIIGVPVDYIRRKEMELQKTEKKYHLLLETLQEGIWTLDKEGYTTYVNQAMADMLGYSIEEMNGRPLFDFMEEKEIEKAREYLQKRREGTKEQHEFKFLKKDGDHIYVTMETGPILDDEGNYIGAIAGIQDITERKEMEEELIKSRNHLRSVFERTQEGVTILNKDLTIREANSTVKRWFHKSLPLEGKKCFSSFHERTRACTPCPTLRCLESGQMEREEIVARIEEKERYLEIFSYPLIEEETETFTGAMEFVIDITERKKAEKALKRSERQFKAIFDVASVGIVQVDPRNGKLLRYNERYQEITGYRDDELLKKKFPELTHPEDREKDWELFSQAVHGERPNYINEKRYIQKDGSIVWVRLNASIIRNDKGEPIRTVAVCEDITERKETEKRITHQNEELKRLYHRLDEEIERAKAIHERILPRVFPKLESISLAAHYQPALRLGGDFYDVIRIKNKLILYLSDVSGHGIDGSMLSLFVKHTIKTYLSFTPKDLITPANILQYLADQFREEDYPEEYFICIFMGVLDLETMNFIYSGVGFQDSPLVQLGNGAQIELITKGLFITSCFPERMKNFQEYSLELTPGTTIFLNTDGLTEQENNKQLYVDRLSHVFYHTIDQPPELIVQSVIQDFIQFNHGSMQGDDDITFLVLQVNKEKC